MSQGIKQSLDNNELLSPLQRGKRKNSFPRFKTMIMTEPKSFLNLSEITITRVRRMDDEIFKTQTTSVKLDLGFAGMLLGIFLFTYLVTGGGDSGLKSGEKIASHLIFGGIPTLIALYGLLRPQKFLILDRKHGTISIPPRFWGKPNVVPFDICFGAIGTMPGGANSMHYHLEIWPNDKYSEGGIACPIDDQARLIEYWSLLVWYMDKNRPLPPCKELDSFRDRDFERRKAEGFPLPLYLSHIDTPEATPEQQRERDKHWPKNLAGKMPRKK